MDNLLLEKVKASVENWKILSNQKGSIQLDEAMMLFKKHFEYFPSVTIPDATHGMSVFRTRVIAKDSTEDITDPKTFSYAPVTKTLGYQREHTWSSCVLCRDRWQNSVTGTSYQWKRTCKTWRSNFFIRMAD